MQINITGETDDAGNYLTQKEIDVVAKFSYGGKKILLFFECEDSTSASGVRKHYREYNADIMSIRGNLDRIRVVNSTDKLLQGRHFMEIDVIAVCLVYGSRFSESALQACLREAKGYTFLVWSHLELTYYRKISSILDSWTKYELFKDFSLDLESAPNRVWAMGS